MTTANMAIAPFDLSDLDPTYQEAEAREPSEFTDVPDGTYQVKIDRVELAQSQTGNRMLKWQYRILSGNQANRVIFKNSMLETPENLKFLKGDLATCGLVLDRISELPARLGDLLDITLEVKKVTKGEYSNVYINKRIVVDGAAIASSGAATSADQSLCPF